MTADEFREARRKLGLSARQMADLIGLEGQHRDRTVRRYEAGDLPVSGTIARLLGYIMRERGLTGGGR